MANIHSEMCKLDVCFDIKKVLDVIHTFLPYGTNVETPCFCSLFIQVLLKEKRR